MHIEKTELNGFMDAPITNLFKTGAVLFTSPGSLPKAISAGLYDTDAPPVTIIPLAAPTKNAAIGAQSAIQQAPVQAAPLVINVPVDFPAPVENKIPWGIVATIGALGAAALLM